METMCDLLQDVTLVLIHPHGANMLVLLKGEHAKTTFLQ